MTRREPVAWNSEYWDLMTRLFWEPKRIECKSICGRRKEKEVINRLKRLEVPLNDIFNIFLRIAPSRFPGRLFSRAFDSPFDERFEFFGLEVADRYGFGNENITQQDAFLVGDETLLMIELKIGAKTKLEQVEKYALLAALEESETGPRERLLLLYLTPKKRFHQIWEEKFNDREELKKALKRREYKPKSDTKRELDKIFPQHIEDVPNAMGRMEVGFMTYAELADALALEKKRTRLNPDAEGDETLTKLIDGLHCELMDRKNSQLTTINPD